jgi:ankyrin repeat protein
MDPEKAVQSGRRSYAGRSALHWAARNGHGDVVEYLLSRGVAADSKTADGSTAFAWAAWRGQMDVMRLIVEHGCDQHLCNDYGCNVACWTTMGAGGVECCEYLASLGVRFDLINANGHSTLHKAAQRGNQAVLSWLLDTPHLAITARHARPDSEGYAPADLARVEGFRDVADWLATRQTTLPSTAVDR